MKNLLLLWALLATYSATSQVQIVREDSGVWFIEGERRILFYRSKPKSLYGNYQRANYIHPLYTLKGQELTEDFPEDHLHHRGIFWAWHQVYVGEVRVGDAWEIEDFEWEVTSVRGLKGQGASKAIEAEVLWKSPLYVDKEGSPKPFVQENTIIEVYPQGDGYRIIDVEIHLKALKKHVRIGGSEDAKGYGGFSPRIKLADSVQFRGPNGLVQPDKFPVWAGGWLDIQEYLQGENVGFTIIAHPDNPGYPNPWILRMSNSMQNAVYPHPGANAIPLKNLSLKYRMIVHEGQLSPEDIERLNYDE